MKNNQLQNLIVWRVPSACHVAGVDHEVGRNGKIRGEGRAIEYYDRACALGIQGDCTRSQALKGKSPVWRGPEPATGTCFRPCRRCLRLCKERRPSTI